MSINKALIERVTHIVYRWKVPNEVLEKCDYKIDSGSMGETCVLSLYESFGEDQEVIINFWAHESGDERSVHIGGESLFETLGDSFDSFAGNDFVSKQILCMGWEPWEDELDLEANQKIIQAIGDDYGGTLNLEKIMPSLKKFDRQNLAVFRTMFFGRAKIGLDDVRKTNAFTPESFKPNDNFEAARFRYRFK
jgi:hypothetical protein